MEKLYNAREVAKIVGVHYNTVLGWVKTGLIETTKIGGVIRISESQLNKALGKDKPNGNL